MSIPSPLLFRRQTLELLAEIEKTLAVKPPDGGLGWQAQKGGPGQGMVELFGRFLDIIVARLNKAPQQHFLAYLSEGGIDQLPPIAATTQLLFTPEKDAPRPSRFPPARRSPRALRATRRRSSSRPSTTSRSFRPSWCVALRRTSAPSRTTRPVRTATS